jgi:hypothetical protein
VTLMALSYKQISVKNVYESAEIHENSVRWTNDTKSETSHGVIVLVKFANVL